MCPVLDALHGAPHQAPVGRLTARGARHSLGRETVSNSPGEGPTCSQSVAVSMCVLSPQADCTLPKD